MNNATNTSPTPQQEDWDSHIAALCAELDWFAKEMDEEGNEHKSVTFDRLASGLKSMVAMIGQNFDGTYGWNGQIDEVGILELNAYIASLDDEGRRKP